MVQPNCTTDCLEALVREAADELTLRAEDAGMPRSFIDTTDVADNLMGASARR